MTTKFEVRRPTVPIKLLSELLTPKIYHMDLFSVDFFPKKVPGLTFRDGLVLRKPRCHISMIINISLNKKRFCNRKNNIERRAQRP